jgi:hypothetical protein
LQNKENDQNKKQSEMDFLKAVNIIGRDLEEAMALLEQLSGISGSDLAEIELARSRIRSAADLLKLLPALGAPNEKKETDGYITMDGPQAAAKAAEAAAKTRHISGTFTTATPETEPPLVKMNLTEPPLEKTDMAEPHQVKTQMAEPATKVSQPVTDVGTIPGKKEIMPDSHGKKQMMQGQPEEVAGSRPAGASQKNQESSKAILADRFTRGDTLGEKITTGKKEEVISTVIQGKPITDIAAAIGINDRFYFIRELFSGDARAYSDTIVRLNAALSLGEAMKILDESTVMGSDPAAQSSFVDVVRRKFSLNV